MKELGENISHDKTDLFSIYIVQFLFGFRYFTFEKILK